MQSRRQAMKLLAAAAAGPWFAACGMQPLYGPTRAGAPMSEVLAGVEVASVPGRVGQKVRNELVFGLTGGDRPGAAKYRLELAVRESLTDMLVQRSGVARGQSYSLDVGFKLVRQEDGAVTLEGRSLGRATLDRFDPMFANVRAVIDAENRAARQVAESIKTRVAAYLATAA